MKVCFCFRVQVTQWRPKPGKHVSTSMVLSVVNFAELSSNALLFQKLFYGIICSGIYKILIWWGGGKNLCQSEY